MMKVSPQTGDGKTSAALPTNTASAAVGATPPHRAT
jgi:hypothetical protein